MKPVGTQPARKERLTRAESGRRDRNVQFVEQTGIRELPCKITTAHDPDVPVTGRSEDLMEGLRQVYTIVIVTHNRQQAGRVADRTAFFTALAAEGSGDRTGMLVEYDKTTKIFENPSDQRTEDYISGRFG